MRKWVELSSRVFLVEISKTPAGNPLLQLSVASGQQMGKEEADRLGAALLGIMKQEGRRGIVKVLKQKLCRFCSEPLAREDNYGGYCFSCAQLHDEMGGES